MVGGWRIPSHLRLCNRVSQLSTSAVHDAREGVAISVLGIRVSSVLKVRVKVRFNDIVAVPTSDS